MPQWIIEKKRDGASLTPEEIGFLVRGYASGSVADYQMAAFMMAVAIRGMTFEETCSLTRCMLESGVILDTSPVHQPKIDKHSTGGIGDKISLILAPLAAACGVAVPMIAGRGLGITGGTLDKLESIPGYRTRLDEDEFVGIVKQCGCAIAGASEKIAPADRKIYALRDVTGTVPSIPLIAASILSKKLAAGLEGIVFDVKWGRGAFMKTRADAKKLAKMLVEVGRLSKLRSTALITDMNQPLGAAVGNALEVMEATATLQGRGPADVIELTLALGVQMLLLGGVEADADAARRRMLGKISSGEALARLKMMVRLQGGNPDVLDRPDNLAKAGIKFPVAAETAGYVQEVDAGLIGRAVVALGAGRARLEDKIDHAVGMAGIKKIGDAVERGEPLAWIYANSEERLAVAKPLASAAFRIGAKRVQPPRLIVEEV